MYKPLPVKSSPQTNYVTSMMPKSGMNLEDFSQVMSLGFALKMINYIPSRKGVEKRKGLRNAFERAGANPITLMEEFMDKVWIIGYAQKVEAYNENTDTWTTIKSDWSANNGFCGQRYGEYFFVCNGVEKIWRIDNALSIAEIATSPVCNGLKVIGARIYAFNLATDPSGIEYSEIDDASNPPFDGWSPTTAADTAGTVNFRNAGTVRSVCQLGQYTVAFSDNGFFAFYINVQDSGGILKKIETVQNYTEDFGGARGAIETPEGIYYINEAGLWQMVSTGVTYTPMSKQQVLTSTLLGSTYFQDVDQTTSDLVYDANQKCIFATVKKESETNNLVIGYKPELKSMFEIKGWNINRFAKSGSTIYGASSVKTTAYELFSGHDDDGLNIGTMIYLEVPLKTLFHAHSLSEAYAGGALSTGSEIKINFDIYNKYGDFRENVEELTWTANDGGGQADGWADAIWGESAWGGGFDLGGLIQSFGGGSPKISNFQRLLVKLTSGDKLPHVLNWLALKTTQKAPIKRRNFINSTLNT